MAFLKFPYTDAHQLNLDWIIKIVESIPEQISRAIHESGLVQSVNGQTGNVTLDASDVGALPDSYTAPVSSVNGQTGAVSLDASDVGAAPDDALYAGAVVQGGIAVGTQAIPYGQLDADSTSTVMKATIPGITALRNGVTILLKNGVVTSASGVTLDINNLGAKPIYSSMAAASAVSTIFNINYTMLMIYDETRVAGGCWVAYYGYYSDKDTTAYIIRTLETTLPVTDSTYRYRLLFTSADNQQYVPANASTSTSATTAKSVNQKKIDPFGPIRYYNYTTSVSAGNKPNKSYLNDQNILVLGHSFNVQGNETLTAYAPVYLKCAPQSDGSAIMDSTTPIVQTIPSSEDGKIYIFLGIAYDTTHLELYLQHPIYYFKDGSLRIWTNPQQIPVQSVNGQTGVVSLTAADVGALASNAINTTNEISLNAYDINSNLTIRAGVYVRSGNTVQVRMTLNVLADILNGEILFYSDEFKQKMAQTIFIGRCAATANIVGITVATTSTGIEISAAGRIPAGDWTFFTFDCLT